MSLPPTVLPELPESLPDGSRILVGADLTTVARVTRLLGEESGIEARVFTARESAYCRRHRSSGQHFAARFAAKEAVLKAFGTGVGPGLDWTDVEVINNRQGKPDVRLHGGAVDLAREHQVREISLTLTHTADIAAAYAALLCGGTVR
ncbi:holo-ACP synthase [Nocardia sp. BSTN01]|uniref:holo-ACP synthase n=1 Tax=Nocardia sp. BSTN01 TaxID=2783665 RepID=UPI001E5E97A3|nr:holo-ACP synthase [Nocardia sp. BSTN01]